jgi:hypothetical protein
MFLKKGVGVGDLLLNNLRLVYLTACHSIAFSLKSGSEVEPLIFFYFLSADLSTKEKI